MRITSELICQAADQLNGFVGLNRKTGQYSVRFSEDSFGMDVAADGTTRIDEAVGLAAEFSTPESPAFLNGLLNAAVQRLSAPGDPGAE